MKKLITLFLLICTLFTLVSCGDDEELPEGMQLARGGEEHGYYFYVPEEWVVGNMGAISSAYASNVDKTSASFVIADMPEVELGNYFKSSMASFPYEYTLNVDGQPMTFGNAQSAIYFVYDYDAGDDQLRTMQVLSRYEDRLGIFTFTSYRTNRSSADASQYDYFREKRQAMIDNFKYCAYNGSTDAPEYVTDEDGYRLVSNKTVAKFSLYVPEKFSVIQSSGIVECRADDGACISMTLAKEGGVVVTDYWKNRRAELEGLFGTVTEISVDTPATLGESDGAFSYEYTYTYAGKVYHVYQILAIEGFNGYVFTYTASDAVYGEHIDTVKIICDKVSY